jgi:hypothetical protein
MSQLAQALDLREPRRLTTRHEQRHGFIERTERAIDRMLSRHDGALRLVPFEPQPLDQVIRELGVDRATGRGIESEQGLRHRVSKLERHEAGPAPLVLVTLKLASDQVRHATSVTVTTLTLPTG